MLSRRWFSVFFAGLLISAAGFGAPRKPAPARPPAAVRRWMKRMTLRDKAAQLVFIPFNGFAPNTRSRQFRHYVQLVRDARVGGLVLVNWSQGRVVQRAEPYTLAAFVNRMQRLARVPLLVAGDFERGASMRVSGTTVFPHAMAFGAAGDPAFTRYEGEVTAREARAMGVQWLFYPDADVNNNPDNPIINIRSFGEDPRMVAANVRAFIEGAHADPRAYVLATAKHFPGHGDTSVDTHLSVATVTADRAHLEDVELVPFRAAIQAGVDSIMSAHLAVPALDPSNTPSTLSASVLSGLLRKEMGFRGLVVTDALEMGGITNAYKPGEAAVRAVEAGADVLVMSPDPEAAISAIVEAVRRGQISRRRLEESVERILSAKVRVGLNRRRYVNPAAIEEEVNTPESNEKAQEIADRAVTLVRNQGGLVPLQNPARTCFLVLVESRSGNEGVAFTQELRKRAPAAAVITLDPLMTGSAIDDAARRVEGADHIVVAAFGSVAAYRGNTALAGEFPRLVDLLTASGKPVILVSLGNPYMVRSFPQVNGYLAAFSTVPPSETAVVKALFGEIPIRGHLPVTIPGIAKYGEGIQLTASPRSAQVSALK